MLQQQTATMLAGHEAHRSALLGVASSRAARWAMPSTGPMAPAGEDNKNDGLDSLDNTQGGSATHSKALGERSAAWWQVRHGRAANLRGRGKLLPSPAHTAPGPRRHPPPFRCRHRRHRCLWPGMPPWEPARRPPGTAGGGGLRRRTREVRAAARRCRRRHYRAPAPAAGARRCRRCTGACCGAAGEREQRAYGQSGQVWRMMRASASRGDAGRAASTQAGLQALSPTHRCKATYPHINAKPPIPPTSPQRGVGHPELSMVPAQAAAAAAVCRRQGGRVGAPLAGQPQRSILRLQGAAGRQAARRLQRRDLPAPLQHPGRAAWGTALNALLRHACLVTTPTCSASRSSARVPSFQIRAAWLWSRCTAAQNASQFPRRVPAGREAGGNTRAGR